jgi:hypothetical protein
MLSLLPSQPIGDPSELGRLFSLINFISDREAVEARIVEIKKAADDSAAIISTADAVKADIEKAREAMQAEHAQAEDQLAADREAFESNCAAREEALTERETDIARLTAETQRERDEAARITSDLNSRLERVKAAAA